MKNKLNILYVDDEKSNLDAFKASFRRKYSVYLAENAEEAHKVIKDKNINIVVSDHKMPGQTGVSFLAQVAKEFPNIVRILITGYGDYDLALESINKGGVFRFLNKPWNKEELHTVLFQAEELYKLKEGNQQLKDAYYNIFNENPNPLILVNYNSLKIEQINSATSFLFGLTEDELLGKHLDYLLSNQPKHNKDKISLSIEKSYKIKTLDEEVKEVEFVPKKIILNHNTYYLLNVVDISRSLNEEKQRQRMVLRIQNEEREKFSMELHDVIAQDLVLLKLALDNQNSKSKKAKAKKITYGILQDIMTKVRNLSYELTPPELENGVIEGLKALFDKFDAAGIIIFKFEIKNGFKKFEESFNLDEDQQYDLYRIAQTFINNSIQHSRCSIVTGEIDIKNNEFILKLTDNGKGLDFNKVRLGKGIQHIITRSKSHDFELKWDSVNNRGTSLELRKELTERTL